MRTRMAIKILNIVQKNFGCARRLTCAAGTQRPEECRVVRGAGTPGTGQKATATPPSRRFAVAVSSVGSETAVP